MDLGCQIDKSRGVDPDTVPTANQKPDLDADVTFQKKTWSGYKYERQEKTDTLFNNIQIRIRNPGWKLFGIKIQLTFWYTFGIERDTYGSM